MSNDQRKAETRHKIQLGGIVIKAGVGAVDAFALLGLLIEHRDILIDPGEQQRLRAIARAYSAETANKDGASGRDESL